MAIAPEEVGRRIADRRKELGWTHEQLAARMSVGLRTVQRWQKGRNPKTGKSWLPRLSTLMELADVMEVDRSYFLDPPEERATTQDLAARLGSLETNLANGFEAVEAAIAQLADELRHRGAR